MKRIMFIILLSLVPVIASADDLDNAYTICQQHANQYNDARSTASLPPYKSGWEHCSIVADSWTKRNNEKNALDENANPDLKFTRDIAKKIAE